MAAVVHFAITAEAADVHLEIPLPHNLGVITAATIDFRTLLFHLSRAQQHLIYSRHRTNNSYSRASRYNPQLLQHDLASAIIILVAAIPSYKREQAMQDATDIMTKRL
jgi:hypothetical protein